MSSSKSRELQKTTKAIRGIVRIRIIVISLWSAIIVFLGILQSHSAKQQVIQSAKIHAKLSLQKDLAYRFWAAKKGGVYVPVTSETQPNPYLKIPHRDVETHDGMFLTLMNPAYMTRQVQSLERKRYGHSGHLTSLRPLRPANKPDLWERHVLEKMPQRKTQNDAEVHEEKLIQGKPYLRWMKALYVQESCLKCHAEQGYKTGDLRGGLSVSVPLQDLYAMSRTKLKDAFVIDALIWLLGMLGLVLASSRLKKLIRAEHAENMARQAAQGEFRMLFDSIVDAVSIHDNQGKFALVNGGYQRLLGYSPEEQLAMLVSEISIPDEPVPVPEPVKQMQKQGHVVFSVRLRHKDGHLIPCEVNARMVEYRGQTMILSIARDISERIQAEQARLDLQIQLRETQKLESLGVLAGGIAHDFNNLLTVLSGNAEIARDELADVDSEARRCIDEILQASQLATKLVKQMLDYSGRGAFVLEPQDVNALARETSELLQRSLPKSSQIKLELAEPLPRVLADRGQLQQLLMNLLINASEALDGAEGQLVLRTELRLCHEENFADLPEAQRAGLEWTDAEQRFVCLELDDTGVGMTEEQLSRIFEPFYTTKFTGRGLGMAAILGIVRGHGAAIRVRSKPGQGTRVEVMLPAEDDAEKNEVEQALNHNDLPRPAKNKDDWTGRVLIVDDEEAVLSFEKRLLQRLGFAVQSASSGQAALDIVAAEQSQFCAVLLDLSMPEMNGAEVFSRLREMQAKLPIILCSGYDAADIAPRFDGLDVSGFLHKPFNRQDLEQVFAALCEYNEASDSDTN